MLSHILSFPAQSESSRIWTLLTKTQKPALNTCKTRGVGFWTLVEWAMGRTCHDVGQDGTQPQGEGAVWWGPPQQAQGGDTKDLATTWYLGGLLTAFSHRSWHQKLWSLSWGHSVTAPTYMGTQLSDWAVYCEPTYIRAWTSPAPYYFPKSSLFSPLGRTQRNYSWKTAEGLHQHIGIPRWRNQVYRELPFSMRSCAVTKWKTPQCLRFQSRWWPRLLQAMTAKGPDSKSRLPHGWRRTEWVRRVSLVGE